LASRIRSLARSAAIHGYSSAVTLGGVDRRLLRRLARSGAILVLNLHNVTPARTRFTRPIPPDVFDDLVGWLKRTCLLTTFAELADATGSDSRPFAILSFDDGYRDFIEYAMPILDRHDVRVNQNVIPGCVESGRPPWNVALLDALDREPADRLRRVRLSSGELPPLGETDSDRMRWGVAISRVLKMRPRAEREHLLSELRDQLDIGADFDAQPMMSATEVAEVARHHEVGIHSYDHDSMEYESDDYFAEDLRRCQDWCHARLGEGARVYAFPNGSHRESQINLAVDAGITDVLLVEETMSRRGAHVHPRITADGVTLRELRMRLVRAG
jgi:peptidoglycan/xylan/chitin deacetylase (PgdA/CDA1 family)